VHLANAWRQAENRNLSSNTSLHSLPGCLSKYRTVPDLPAIEKYAHLIVPAMAIASWVRRRPAAAANIFAGTVRSSRYTKVSFELSAAMLFSKTFAASGCRRAAYLFR